MRACNLPKSAVPRLVTCYRRMGNFVYDIEIRVIRLTGSQPAVAVEPLVPQPGFNPEVISLKPLTPVE